MDENEGRKEELREEVLKKTETSEIAEISERSEISEEAQVTNLLSIDSEASETSEASDEEKPSVEELIAEAEQRGYLRGRNEKIEQLMAAPGLYERIDTPQQGLLTSDNDSFELLCHRRISIWDK